MTKRYRLTTRAQMGGAIQEPGHEFTLEDGEKGPMRAVVASDHGANHGGQPGGLVDVPLYVEIEEPTADLVIEDGIAADHSGPAADVVTDSKPAQDGPFVLREPNPAEEQPKPVDPAVE